MHPSVLFFRISDYINHPLRNYKRYNGVKCDKNLSFDPRFANDTAMDVYYPKDNEGALPVLVNVHGGGFVRGDKKYRSGIARYFASHGWFVANINYRLAPKHIFPASTEDVISALNFINTLGERYPLDLSRIVVTGDSAGGYYAAHAVAAIHNESLRERLSLPAYTGEKIRALLTFCAPFNLMQCFGKKVALNVARDVSNCVFGTNHKDYEYPNKIEYRDAINLVNLVESNFPQTFAVAAEKDSFCGGQIDAFLDKLREKGVKADGYVANMKGDGHCTHLFPFKKGSKVCMEKTIEFLEQIKRG
ncbi:MAG: alpha/beta hydrolase [Clostridia bacterium]